MGKMSEWISVNESLPESGKYVLGIYKRNLPMVVMYHSIERHFTMHMEHVFVTHWMPLPPPPAE
jgi:hypothetical protein